MKIVHINTYQSGGAAICAIRIHNSLRNLGVDSKMLFAQGEKNEVFDVLQPEPYVWSDNYFLRKCQVLACKLHLWPKYEYLSYKLDIIKGKGGDSFFTIPLSRYKNIVTHPWVEEADIIHLHWVSGFIDYPSFFRLINKPIVWTLHDENPGLGGFHYTTSQEVAKKELYDSLNKKCLDIKIKAYTQFHNFHLVAISSVMKSFIQRNDVLRMYPVSSIFNGIDECQFNKKNKTESRIDLSLPTDNRKVFLFSSFNIWEERKGLKELIIALEHIDFDYKPTLVCLGMYDTKPKSEKIDFICPGLVDDKNLMSKYYSAADFFLMPSFQESFGQTPVESMSCGTPVVAFPSGIIPELIRDYNGVICRDYTVESLSDGIKCAMSRKYDSKIIREDIVTRFSYKIISQQYLDLYKRI